MSQDVVFAFLLQPLPVWIVLALGIVPALIARFHHRPLGRWCFYGFGCALLTWPLVVLPTLHALFARDRDRQTQRRADALALLKEDSVRSFPSHIVQLRQQPRSGAARPRHAYERLAPGDSLVLVREAGEDAHGVAYYHRGIQVGYVPKRQRWIADALDDGLRLFAVTDSVKSGWIPRRSARYVGTRIVVLYDGR